LWHAGALQAGDVGRDPTNRFILKTFIPAVLAAALLSLPGALGRGAPAPDSSPLIRVAELGDAVEQFNYAQHLAPGNAAEKLGWLMRSAEQGFPPAQDLVGAYYDGAAATDAPNSASLMSEAVRWSSRAAYQALPASQLRLANFYESGRGLPRDLVRAAMWLNLTLTNPETTPGEHTLASASVNRIQTATSAANLAEGRRLATAFTYPTGGGLNPVEIQLLTTELKLTAIAQEDGRAYALVNSVRFFPGEPADAKVDGYTFRLTALAIDARSVRFNVSGSNDGFTLGLSTKN